MSKEAQEFYQTLKGRVPAGELTIAKLRIGFEQLLKDFPPGNDVHFEEIDLGKIPAAWIHSKGGTREKVILFLHGGGYSAGDFMSHGDLIGRIAKAAKCDIFAIDYRLGPEHPFPAAVEDTLTAYHYLTQKEKLNPEQIIVVGVSAGGGLALSLFLKLKELKEPQPRAGICICPWVDLAFTGKTLDAPTDIIQKDRIKIAADFYLKGHNPKDPLASPLYGDLHNLPPLLIQVGSHEILLDEIERLSEKAKKSGVQVTLQRFPDMFHTWQLFAAKIPEGQQAIEMIGKFVQSL